MTNRLNDKHREAAEVVARIRKALVEHIVACVPLAREMQQWRNDLCDVEDVLRSVTPSAELRSAENMALALQWMACHDALLGFIQKSQLLKELIENDPRPPMPNPESTRAAAAMLQSHVVRSEEK